MVIGQRPDPVTDIPVARVFGRRPVIEHGAVPPVRSREEICDACITEVVLVAFDNHIKVAQQDATARLWGPMLGRHPIDCDLARDSLGRSDRNGLALIGVFAGVQRLPIASWDLGHETVYFRILRGLHR